MQTVDRMEQSVVWWDTDAAMRSVDMGSDILAIRASELLGALPQEDRETMMGVLERMRGMAVRLADYRKDADRLDWLEENADTVSVGRSHDPNHKPPFSLREWIDDYKRRLEDSHLTVEGEADEHGMQFITAKP